MIRVYPAAGILEFELGGSRRMLPYTFKRLYEQIHSHSLVLNHHLKTCHSTP